MTLEHKYYSFDEMPEWYEFIGQGSIYKYRKVGGKLECYVGGERGWIAANNSYTSGFLPLPPKPKLYEKYLNGKRELGIKSLNGHDVLKVEFIMTAHGYKQAIKKAIPAINAFLEDICGEGL